MGTLYLKGKYKEKYAANILQIIAGQPDIYVSINEWQHDFSEHNFIKATNLSELLKQQLIERDYFKIALKYELHHWNMMQLLLPEGYNKIKNLLIS